MTDRATIRVMSSEEILASAAGRAPIFHWPERATLFAERQMRLRQLAQGHAMGDFLRFMAELARVQHAALQRLATVPVPDPETLERAARSGAPLLPAADWPRDPAWRAELRAMVEDLRSGDPPEGVRAALDTIDRASDDELEAQADCLLTGVMHGLDLATAPLVAAALQVYWTHLVLSLPGRHDGGQDASPHGPFGHGAELGVCPCCGSRPTASLTRHAGGATGQRYLHCSLCSTQWHLESVRCAHCLSAEQVAYQSLEATDVSDEVAAARAARAAVQAETCDDCGHYLKIMHGDRNPQVDPVADDLATVTLDLLVSDSGKLRYGVNLMLLFGEPEPPPRAG